MVAAAILCSTKLLLYAKFCQKYGIFYSIELFSLFSSGLRSKTKVRNNNGPTQSDQREQMLAQLEISSLFYIVSFNFSR